MGQLASSFATGVDKKKRSIQWKIKNFDIIANNNELISEQNLPLDLTFGLGTRTIYRTSWTFYLKYSEEKLEDQTLQWIGLHCQLTKSAFNGDIPTWAQVSVTIVNPKDQSIFFGPRESQMQPFVPGSTTGWSHIIKKGTPASELPLEHGTLTIKIKLAMLSQKSNWSFAHALKEFENASKAQLLQDLEAVFDCESPLKGLKVVTTSGREYSACKIILSGRSPVLAKTFDSQVTEEQAQVIKLDASDKTAEFLMAYLHTGKVCSHQFSCVEDIVEVSKVASKLELQELHNFCDLALSVANARNDRA